MGNRKQEIQFIPHFIKLEESKYILDERSISTNSKITLPLQKQTNKQTIKSNGKQTALEGKSNRL